MSRTPRTRFERLLYSAVYKCPRCQTRLGWHHRFISRQLVRLKFVFSWRSHCVRCGTWEVHQIDRRDPVDEFTHSPLGLIQRLLGAPIKKCPACRLQYYDWRKAV